MQVAGELALALRRDRGADRLLHRRQPTRGPSGRRWRRGLDVVVGTPGRLREPSAARGARVSGHVAAWCSTRRTRCWRADFREDLEALLAALPEGRQTLMFSATVSAAGRGAGAAVPARCAAASRRRRGARVSSCRGWWWRRRDRERRSSTCCGCTRRGRRSSSAAGARRRATLAERLAARGFAVVALSGALSQAGPQRGAGGDARGAGAGLRGDRPRGAGLRPAGARAGAARRPAGERRDRCCTAPGAPGRAGRGGLAVLVVPPAQRRRAEALAARAGLRDRLGGGAGPARRSLARDLERMLAEAAGPAPDAEEAAVAARLLAAHGAQRDRGGLPAALGVGAAGGGRLLSGRPRSTAPCASGAEPLSSRAGGRQGMRYSAWAIVRNALSRRPGLGAGLARSGAEGRL